tara:strand:- start:7332 stop:8303 length:972 start_codon:yes stop_codon:yes gene_type:complete
MKTALSNTNNFDSDKQLSLYGYDSYFLIFKKLFENNNLPNSILLSGPKGIGKATFAYHFINYILSQDEENHYSLEKFKINEKNQTYNKILTNTHPNFYQITNLNQEQIKIEQIRNLLKFLSKTTYSKDIKIILIDNLENLNVNSTNALLKAIEEPKINTFFIIIHNYNCKILETIKSRCVEFKINFSEYEKKKIFKKLLDDFNLNSDLDHFNESLYFETPGNLLNFISILNNSNINEKKDTLSYISFFLDSYNNKKDTLFLDYASLFIQKFYSDLCNKNLNHLNRYLNNYSKILNEINYSKKYNLNYKNTLIKVKDILHNEKR